MLRCALDTARGPGELAVGDGGTLVLDSIRTRWREL